MSDAGAPSAVTVLFTCVGRRIELLQSFRAAAQRLGIGLRLVAADVDASAPGLLCADVGEVVPRVADAGYIAALEQLVRRERVRLVIPTTDTDLPAISGQRERLERAGALPLIGPPETINTCRDKLLTYAFLRRIGVDTPATYTAEEMRGLGTPQFPYFVKPRFGSASESAHRIEDATDLAYFLAKGREPIFQEFVAGREYTLDVYVGLGGQVRCVVPRLRLAVRGGEVSKGVVVRDATIMEAGRRVVEALGPPQMRGVVTLQCIRTHAGALRFIEINPRFGGGAPLSIAAGADFPGWLLAEALGRTPEIDPAGFAHGLCMERFDWSAFVQLGEDLQPRISPPLRELPRFE